MRWLKWLGWGVGIVAVIIGLLFGWYQLQYGPNQVLGHNRIMITLPYGPANEPMSIRALGEIEDVHPFGHPGIDFGWDHAVPLIAVADGTISGISRAQDMGEPVWYLTLTSGEYLTSYKELDTYTPGLKQGSQVKQGDEIGTPHCTYFADSGGHTGCQLHWEFAYASFLPTIFGKVDRLCPLTYFDTTARQRLETTWMAVKASGNSIPGFPDLCNSQYAGLDE